MKKSVLVALLLSLATLDAGAQNNDQQDTSFKPSGELYGYVFGDYAFKFQTDEQKRGAQQYSGLKKDYSSFNIRRLYLQYRYRFTPVISSHITLAHESGTEANSNRTDLLPDGNRSIFVKHAYIQFDQVISRAAIVLGQQATPTFSRLSETIWHYRSIEKTVTDMRGISASSDLGLGVYGKIGKKERWGYDVLYANNSGTKFITDTHKKLYTSLYTYFFDKKLVVQVNYEYNRTLPFSNISGNTQLVKAFMGYETAQTSVGVEVFKQFNKNATLYRHAAGAVNSFSARNTAAGISAFYTGTIQSEKLNFFARIDWFNPDTNFKPDRFYSEGYPSAKELFATIGVDYEPVKNIHFMPNLWLNHYESKSINRLNTPKNGSDIVGRVTFYYLFNK
ncbi:MAG: hypothetical protein M9898_11340 [Chitinophagaceae bacterium]|nr:hypothetical protein [Chitinophagaceae bacterium]